ncbi:Iron-sulfur assembly protein 2 [Penicillium diatomitis]|uniref:Iron-sulfur assembly protein 2 n=1 Tax=Penicillium diatomitis TaxID=2819901 RepID=A0A9W9X6G1_9EURO|nr:Iron-sulfur assembly protein 2 [Penicillium diatomitis]KAJ5485172.1 Iron-sulfur assembly protein 2 [Penicillium diatomitis]
MLSPSFPIHTCALRQLSQAPSQLFLSVRPALRISASSFVTKAATRRFTTAPTAFSAPRSTTSKRTRRGQHQFPAAAFSTSPVQLATKVTQNPRTGDDGETLMINISPRAVTRLREITDPSVSPSATNKENPYHHLRITVTSGGCHGFQYLMSLESENKIDSEEDTIFEGEVDSSENTPMAAGTAKVIMDEPSLELLSGSTVDYTTELIGSQFKIVDNPRATSNCGCGTSFDVMD